MKKDIFSTEIGISIDMDNTFARLIKEVEELKEKLHDEFDDATDDEVAYQVGYINGIIYALGVSAEVII